MSRTYRVLHWVEKEDRNAVGREHADTCPSPVCHDSINPLQPFLTLITVHNEVAVVDISQKSLMHLMLSDNASGIQPYLVSNGPEVLFHCNRVIATMRIDVQRGKIVLTVSAVAGRSERSHRRRHIIIM